MRSFTKFALEIFTKNYWMHDLGVCFWPERQRTKGEKFNYKPFDDS